jgi:hypothetical protein
MEQTALTSGFKKQQLFLKKTVVVKFVRTNSLMKGVSQNRNVETTTSIPTSIIRTIGY